MRSARQFAKDCAILFDLDESETNILASLIILRDVDIETAILNHTNNPHDTITTELKNDTELFK